MCFSWYLAILSNSCRMPCFFSPDNWKARSTTSAPEIPWPLVAGMRNVLAHDYGAVDLEKVYEVVTVHVPDLLVQLGTLIPALEKDVGWEGDQKDDSAP